MDERVYTHAQAVLAACALPLPAQDAALLRLCAEKATLYVLHACGVTRIPEGLVPAAGERAAGCFLQEKKALAPDFLAAAGLSSGGAATQIRLGDTAVTLQGDTPEKRLDALITALLTSGKEALACYRRIRW